MNMQTESRTTLLLIDEDNEFQKYFRTIMEQDSYTVIPCQCVSQALTCAYKAQAQLILFDVNTKQGNGLALCAQLKRDPLLRSVPLIIVSALATERDVVHGLKAGADDYVTKPFSVGELKARIKAMLRSYRELSTQLQTTNR